VAERGAAQQLTAQVARRATRTAQPSTQIARATGETYCIAHHVFSADGERKIMLAYLRYLDSFVKQQRGTWLFAERNLYLEFSDTRVLGG
jgi:SnoaL-like domain